MLKMKHECQEYFHTTFCTSPRLSTPFEKTPSDLPDASENKDANSSMHYNKYHDVVHTAEIVLQVLKNRDFVDPLRVLGIKCDSRISIWILSTLFICTVAVFQYAIFGSLYI